MRNILITYDVNTETKEGRRRLRQVATVCQDFGQRVQNSVFECSLNDSQYESLRAKLIKIIDSKIDSIRFYKLPSSRDSCIECYGVDKFVDFDEPLIF